MYKSSNRLLPDVLITLFIKNSEIHTYSTGSKDLFHILPGTQIFSNISVEIWNSLTVNINVNVTFIKFKESLKLYLLNNTLLIYYYTLINTHTVTIRQFSCNYQLYLIITYVKVMYIEYLLYMLFILFTYLLATPVKDIV